MAVFTKTNTHQTCLWYMIELFLITGFSIMPCIAQDDKIMACYFAVGTTQSFSGKDIDPFLCTHIICSGGVITPTGVEPYFPYFLTQWKNVSSLKSKNPNLKVMISLEGEFSSFIDSGSSSLYASFSLLIVTFLEKINMDGVDLDWEFPSSAQKQNYMTFLQVLGTYLHSSNMILSMALPPYPSMIDTGYELNAVNNYVDFVTVMNYDYHGYSKADNITGYNSPLYTPKGEPMYSSTADCLTWMLANGLSRKKTLMGIPTYGRSWNLVNPADHGLHSPANGLGSPAPYSHIKGRYFYPDVCMSQKKGVPLVNDEVNVGEYLYNGTTWAAVEGKFSIALKMQWVRERELAGVGIWAYNYDDIKGVCGDGKMPLLNWLKTHLNNHTLSFVSEKH